MNTRLAGFACLMAACVFACGGDDDDPNTAPNTMDDEAAAGRGSISAAGSMSAAAGTGSVSTGTDEQDAGPQRVCVPGMQAACGCAGAEIGVQVCLADGSGFGECGQCEPEMLPDTGDMMAEPPATVTIEILGALVNLSMASGEQWDSFSKVPPAALEAVSTALGVPGTGAVLGVIQDQAATLTAAPDPYGTAELNLDGTGFDPTTEIVLADTSTNIDNVYVTSWPGPPGWRDVAFSEDLKVRFDLFDEDPLMDDEPLLPATIDYHDLLEAWIAGDSHWIRVDDQTQKQLIAVQIQVSGK